MRKVRAMWRSGVGALALVFLVCAVSSIPTAAQKVKEGHDELDALAFGLPELRVNQQMEEVGQLRASLGARAAEIPLFAEYDTFLTREGGRWLMQTDRFTGRAALVEGSGIPWIPGAGNLLRYEDLGLNRAMASSRDIPVGFMADKALTMVAAYPELFGADPADLELVKVSSGPMLDYLYYLHFTWSYKGVPVENAYVVFRLNSGNLVQFGSEGIEPVAIQKVDPIPTFGVDTAWQILQGLLGGPGKEDKVLEPGRLSILPISTAEALQGTPVFPGTGLTYRLVYTLSFRRPGVMGTWEAKIDAHTGQILSFLDANQYGSIKGGVYKTDQPATEVSVPFPFADYSGTAYADAAGNFTGTVGTSTMTGRVGTATTVGGVDIVDNCGAISKVADGAGVIDFGTSPATDCSTGGGGAGDTRAARTQYYNVSMIKIKAYTYLPGNNWLEGRVTDNVNLNQTCNAYWNGTSLNFFRSGGGCWNTGELPGVSLHEWAHGMDSNDGSPAGDRGTGETYGDFSGTLQTHGSCAGGGFFLTLNRGCGTTTPGFNCSGYGDCCLSCSGIREIDYAKHNQNKPYFPEDLTSNVCAGCSTFACTASATYAGPCGREGHCESLVSSQAMWDLPVRDLVTWGMDLNSAWQLMDKLWYASRSTSGSVYTCPSVTTANGCGTSHYFTTFRVVDDCDGDLTNGTPHASAIFAAFNRHKIGCTTVVNTDNNCGCATLATPVLAGTPGNNNNYLTWGAVAGASSYTIYRNDAGCSAGYTNVGNTATLAFTDTPVTNGVTYYYRIQANGAGSCPPSPMSNCVTLVPVPCTTPGVPTIGTVTVPGLNQLRVSWTAGAPAGATYKIYRAVLADGVVNCSTGTYTLLASGVAASPYTDSTVSGTVTYGYRVTAVDTTGGCESAQSGCAKNTATGTCNMGPVFGGVTGVTNPANATCTLNVAWSAATAYCGGPVTYTVYRSTTAPFTPGAGNQIAAGLSGTSYSDAIGLVSGTTYYYTVRATDGGNGMTETNTITQSGAPTGPITTGTWTDDAGDTGTAKMLLTAPWSVLATGGRTAPKVYATGTVAASSCQDLKTPVLQLGTGATLSFASKYDIETNWDAGILEVATAPTFTNWTKLNITTYPNGLTNAGNACGFPTSGANTVFSQTIATPTYPANYTASLTAYNGQQVQIRWNLGSDTTIQGAGWWVDDVSITNVQVPGACVTGSGGCTAPGAPNLTSATGTCAGVDLAWTAGTGTTLSYNVYRFTGACGGAYAKIAGPIAGLTYSDTTAVAGTSYAYVIRGACDAGGLTESVVSNCRTATRLAATPAAPTGLGATGTCTAVDLSWTASAGATSYEVWRTTNANCTTAAALLASPAVTTYSDTTAIAGTTYYYTVKAVNSCGTSAVSTCANSARLATPAAPAAPTFSAVGCADLTVNWAAVSGALSYDVYRRTGGCGGGGYAVVGSNIAGISFGDTGLAASTGYAYYIVAKNTCGSSANGICATVTTTGSPVAPAGLTATGTCTAVDLSWTASAGATSYEVWRTTNANCTTAATLINSPAGTTYSDTTAVAGTTYYYTVKGVNTCGTSAVSNCANSARLDVPAAPTAVIATGSCTDVSVSWTGNAQATSYNVVRGAICGTALNTFTNVTSPYSDATAVAGTAYQYWVVAVNTCGSSANSACAAGTRLVTPTPTIAGASANTCPSLAVPLSTEVGMSGYQWYLGGVPIVGATTDTYAATASGNYTVSYISGGCAGTSAPHAVTISACAPNIVYQSSGSFTEITGDGDAFYELGEKWSVQVTLANIGNSIATAVFADLGGNGITVCSTPASFGSIGAGATAAATYEFVISPTFAPCGGTIGFDVLNKSCTELTPAGTDQLDVFSVTVGQGTLGVPTDLVLQPPTGDTYIREDSAGTNYGTATTMNIRTRNANRNQRSLVAFDVSAIPAGSTINSATLELNATVSDIELTLDVHHITGAWSEAAVTWTTAPTFSAAADATTLTGTVTGWKTWNMAPVVQAWVNGTYANNGLLVKDRTEGSASNDTWTFSTKEGAVANAPILRINYTPPGTLDCSYVGTGTCSTCAAPSGLTNSAAADVSACAASGVSVTFAADAGAWGDTAGTRTYDILRDGTALPAGTGLVYPSTNFTDATAVVGIPYTYAVRYNNGCGLNTSTVGTTASDVNDTPGAPVVTAVTDVDACAPSGVQVVFTSGSGATSHDLYDSGTLAVTGYVSGATYTPADTASHNYMVRAFSGTCTTDSNILAGTDANNTPGAPVVTVVADVDACVANGIQVSYTAGSGAISHDLYDNAVLAVTGYVSGATYTPGDTASHNYTVRALNGTCSTDSNILAGADAVCPPPGEVASTPDGTAGTTQLWTSKTDQSWPAVAGATSYTLYRGVLADLTNGNILNSNPDSCTRPNAGILASNLTEDPTVEAGRFYWYLVTATNGAGEGPAGNATVGARTVNSTGACP